MEHEDWEFVAGAARKTVKRLEKAGASQVESFFSATWTSEAGIRNSEILTENASEDMGVSFRVATADNRVGFACTNVVNAEEAIYETGRRAFSMAKLSTPVSGFTLPSKRKAPGVAGLLDEAVIGADVEDFVGIAQRMIQAAEGVDKRVAARRGEVSFSHSLRGVVNSFGIDLEEEETRAVAYLGCNGTDGGKVTPSCYEAELKRDVRMNPEKIGETAAGMVVAQFDPKPVESFEGTIVFERDAVSYQLFDALASALNGENIVSGRSPWIGKLGERVACEKLTLVDHATLEGGFASRAFDDEGCASQKTTLISRGQLVGFLHHATTASRLKVTDTGNASRSGGGFEMARQIVGNGYKARPEVYPSNLVIQPGGKSKDELVSDVEKGVLVGSMAGFVQAGSGLISAQLVRAHYVENGEVKWPISGGMVSGIAFEWFNRIEEVGNDAKQFANSVVPSLKVERVKVIGTH